MTTTTIASPVTSLWLPGKGKGKARPRKCGNAYALPKEYRSTKEKCVTQIILHGIQPITYQCCVECKFVNFKNQ